MSHLNMRQPVYRSSSSGFFPQASDHPRWAQATALLKGKFGETSSLGSWEKLTAEATHEKQPTRAWPATQTRDQ